MITSRPALSAALTPSREAGITPTQAEVVAEAGRGHQDIVSGRMKHALCAESPPPGEDERPGVHRQGTPGMISDQKRGPLRQTLPTRRLEPEVVVAEGNPDVLLSAQQFLVGTVEGVFGSGGGALGDQAFESTRGLALGAPALGHGSLIEGRPRPVDLVGRAPLHGRRRPLIPST